MQAGDFTIKYEDIKNLEESALRDFTQFLVALFKARLTNIETMDQFVNIARQIGIDKFVNWEELRLFIP